MRLDEFGLYVIKSLIAVLYVWLRQTVMVIFLLGERVKALFPSGKSSWACTCKRKGKPAKPPECFNLPLYLRPQKLVVTPEYILKLKSNKSLPEANYGRLVSKKVTFVLHRDSSVWILMEAKIPVLYLNSCLYSLE